MLKYGLLAGLLVTGLCGVSVAQEPVQEKAESAPAATPAPAKETVERVLIADPEPVETEYFLAQGAATAEIVDDEELLADAAALVALSEEHDGDMAAMPEVMEE